jgi:ABC-type enterochelin transport system ATPase subunit
MTPADKSAIMWLIWSIGVCAFAVLVAVNIGAISTYPLHNIETKTHVVGEGQIQDEIQDEIIEFGYNTEITINATQRKQMVCNFRLGLWC